MKENPIQSILLKEILNIGDKIDKRFDKLQKHFDERHDKAFKAINDNSKQIEIIKFKQLIIACLAGLGGAQLSENYKVVFETLKKIFLFNL